MKVVQLSFYNGRSTMQPKPATALSASMLDDDHPAIGLGFDVSYAN